MKALVLEEYGKLSYQEFPTPSPAPDEVLLRVKACGICGSDVHGMDGSSGRRIPPVVMGHEASGLIEQVGEQVEHWQVGDRVTFDSTIYCGTCHFCRKGQINLCDNRRVLGVSCDDYRRHGAFAEYVCVPQRILYRLPDAVTFEQATMVEPISVAVHAVSRLALSLSDTAVVVGSGMIGLLVIQTLRAAGCGQIIAVDLEEEKLELAQTLGASVGLKSDAVDVCEQVLALTEGRGAHAAFEVVGISPTIKLATGCLRKGGSLGLVGNLSASVEFSLQAAVTRELSIFGSCASCGEYPACLELLQQEKILVEPLISQVAPLAEGNKWFQRLYNREQGLMKVILCP